MKIYKQQVIDIAMQRIQYDMNANVRGVYPPLKICLKWAHIAPVKNFPSREREALEIRADRAWHTTQEPKRY